MKTSLLPRTLGKFFALLCAAFLPVPLAATANAQSILAWDFFGEGSNTNTTSIADVYNSQLDSTNVLSRGPGASWSTGANSFRTTGFQNNGISTTNTDYFEFAVSATNGSLVSLSSITARFAGTASFVTNNSNGGATNQFAYSTNGTDWTLIDSPVVVTGTNTTNWNMTAALGGIADLQNLPSSVTALFRFYASGQTTTGGWGFNSRTNGVYGLDVSGTFTTDSAPLLNASTNALSLGNTDAGSPSPSQIFTASGLNLTSDLTVTAPADIEVSSDGVNFSDAVALPQISGSATGTISVRIKASSTPGVKSGIVVLSSTGASSVNVAVTGNVFVPGAPILSLSTNIISALSTSTGVASAATNYSVTGTNLGATPITVTPDSALLQIGTNGTDFTNTLDLVPVGGVVSNSIFLRVAATNVVTNYSATISHISGSASNSLNVSGSITNLPASLVASPTNITGLNAATTNVPSAAQTFALTGSNLTNDVTVSAPAGFEVSNDGATWGTSTSLTQASGSVNGTVSVRFAPSSAFGPLLGNVTNSSSGITTRVAVSGSVPVPDIPGQVYWNFDAATPTSGTGGEYASWSFPAITQNNNNGTTALLNATSASSGYTNPFNVLSSGTTNAGAAARTGAFDPAQSAFFEVQVVVPSNTTTSITNISFGSRSTGTGPAAYSVRSSVDNFAADVFTDTLSTNSSWAMKVAAPVSIALSNGTNTVRIYGYGSSATSSTPGTANWRIDDLTLVLSAGSGPTPPSGLSYTPSAANAVVGAAITSMVPTVTGTVTNYSVDPALPTGISIDPTTGVISGTATSAAAAASYTVTASNSAGSTTASVTIAFVSAAYNSWATGYNLSGPDALPTADPDGDNFNNAQEYAFGTNPTQGNGSLLSTSSSGGNLTVTWLERSDLTYNVQSTANLATTAFANDGTVSVTAGPEEPAPPAGYIRKQFTVAASGNKFYRVSATTSP